MSVGSVETEHEPGLSVEQEVVADIFDGPPSPKPSTPTLDYDELIEAWAQQRKALELEARSRRRRAKAEHVFHEDAGTEQRGEHHGASDSGPIGAPPGRR